MIAFSWMLAFGSGFLSLSEEILWIRLMGFVYQGVPHAFSLVLGLYLLGIALGAALGKRLCESQTSLVPAAGMVLCLAGLVDLALPFLLQSLAPSDPFIRFAGICVLLVLSATIKAVLFPVAHHLGSDAGSRKLGRSLSRVYFLNIAGSTLGPLLTGFVLLDFVSLEGGLRLIGIACLAMATVAFAISRPRRAIGSLIACLLASWFVALDSSEVMSAYAHRPEGGTVRAIISNRHGVIHTVDGGKSGDVVYGGNVYDGRVNIDLATNSNRIDRAYLLAALHPEPKRILMIGLSSGAWLRVLSATPTVQHIDVVEINPGYLDLIGSYPAFAPMLNDSRIRIHIDDGRRWLKRFDGEKYDLIVMNTTFHWRANITNLLSHQFMTLAASHLARDGIMAFNATGSGEALMTAASAFGHAYQWSNFVYAGHRDFRTVRGEAADRLAGLRLDGVSLLNPEQERDRKAIERLLEQKFVSLETAAQQAGRVLEVIYDETMPTEFKYGRGLEF